MVENTLPEGWRFVQLGELSEYINGFAFKPKDWKNKGLPIIRIQNLNGKNEYNYFDSEIKDKYKVYNGDILISWSASLDVYNWQGGDAVLNQHIFNTRVNTDIVTKEFFFQIIKYSLAEIGRNLHGMGMKHITKGKFERILTPLPSLEEQKRIVAKIDNLFAKIDKAISLTEESLVQAKNLLPSVLKEVFENCEGETMTLNQVSEIQPKKNQVKDLDCEVSFVPMKFLNQKKIDFIPESNKNISDVYKGYTYFQDNDVVLAKVIPCFQNGKSGVAKELTNGIGFGSSEFIVFRPKDFILSEWLYYNVSSPDFLREGNNNMSGAVGLKRLIKSFVTDWEIKVPDLKTQKKYIDRITKVSNQSKQTLSKLEEQLGYLKQLKSSILSKAFKGEL